MTKNKKEHKTNKALSDWKLAPPFPKVFTLSVESAVTGFGAAVVGVGDEGCDVVDDESCDVVGDEVCDGGEGCDVIGDEVCDVFGGEGCDVVGDEAPAVSDSCISELLVVKMGIDVM